MTLKAREMDMVKGALIRMLACGFLLAAAVAAAAVDTARAADPRGAPPPGAFDRPPAGFDRPPVASSPGGLQLISLGVGKSIVIDLPNDIKDVLVADPTIANAVIRSTRRAFLIGAKVGQTSILFFDADGRQLAGYEIAVTRDLSGLRAALKEILPERDIKVEGLGERSVVISGVVANAAESQLAYDLAVRFVTAAPMATSTAAGSGGASISISNSPGSTGGSSVSSAEHLPVVNALTISGRDQVMIKVTVAEVQRDIIKQLGIDLNGTLGSGNAVLSLATQNPFTAFGTRLSNTEVTGKLSWLSASLKAMERAGVIRTLAEPNLSAISGENATFLAGGEFPIPAGYTCDSTSRNCQLAVEFKKFGIGLNFTPVVMSEGRISLRVMTEVSELSNENAITLVQQVSLTQTQTTTIPSLRVRRAETTVEIPSGGALAMAGMIQEQTKQQINGLPGLLQVPVLGTLFRSRDYVNRQTELMIIVTPYVVRAVSPKELSRPDDGYADVSDPSAILLGRLNRLYGVTGSADPRRTYFGKYGFILD